MKWQRSPTSPASRHRRPWCSKLPNACLPCGSWLNSCIRSGFRDWPAESQKAAEAAFFKFGLFFRPTVAFASVAEITGLDREIRDFLADQCDAILQIVALGTLDAHRVALNRGLNLQLGILDDLDQLLGQFGLDAHLDLQFLLNLVAGDFLHRLVVEALGALDFLLLHGREQDVLDLVELEIGITVQRDHLVLLIELYLGRGALEVVAVVDLANCDVDGVLQRHHVRFGGEVKARHGDYPKWQT